MSISESSVWYFGDSRREPSQHGAGVHQEPVGRSVIQGSQNSGLEHNPRRWSITYLQTKFTEPALERLYQQYVLRNHRSLLTAFYLILGAFILTWIILIAVQSCDKPGTAYVHCRTCGHNHNNTRWDGSEEKSISAGRSLRLINNLTACGFDKDACEVFHKHSIFALTLGSFLVIFNICIVSVRALYVRLNRLMAMLNYLLITTSLCLMEMDMNHGHSEEDGDFFLEVAMDDVILIFYLIFVNFTVHALTRVQATIMGAVSTLVSLISCAVSHHHLFESLLVRQLLANVIFHASANIAGYYYHQMTDVSHRQTFLDTRNFIAEDLRLAKETRWQQEKKEQLLRNIIPGYLHGPTKVLMDGILKDSFAPRTFYNLIVQSHENVSILFADIVSFTQLTRSLQPRQLVTTLNGLFSEFDNVAREHSCLRIKILGDCYYCVSGVPESTVYHASNCVRMALKMIPVIRCVRERHDIPGLDMRIGIHSGRVLSGILGLKKWQYDIWSTDVLIATRMEATGVPGRVHITETTRSNLRGNFRVEERLEPHTDELLRKLNIKTYLVDLFSSGVAPDGRCTACMPDLLPCPSPQFDVRDRPQPAPQRGHISRPTNKQDVPFYDFQAHRPSAALADDARVNEKLAEAFHLGTVTQHPAGAMPRCRREWLRHESKELNRLTLRFRDNSLEEKYNGKGDSTFKSNLACSYVIYLCILFHQLLTVPRTDLMFANFSIGMLVYFLILFLFYFPLLPQRGRVLAKLFSRKWYFKYPLLLLLALTVYSGCFLQVLNCDTDTLNHVWLHNYSWNREHIFHYLIWAENEGVCMFPTSFVVSCAMGMVAMSTFLRMNYMYLTFLVLLGQAIFLGLFHPEQPYCEVFISPYVPKVPVHILHRSLIYLTLLALTILAKARQLEKNFRMDFLWITRTQEKKAAVAKQQELNNALLENILPKHVLEYFLNPVRDKRELYFKQHKNVAVMFASMPNYTLFDGGPEVLTGLNAIIVEFDKLLSDSPGVEKIKTIATGTYMCSAGLCGDGMMSCAETEQETITRHVVAMTAYAFQISEMLNELSQSLFADYQLRVGISHGEVIAGVIGAQKPLFDIWGDPVNMASRMESHGVPGRVHVTMETASVLSAARTSNFSCASRGMINIRGCGPVETFLVSDDRHAEL